MQSNLTPVTDGLSKEYVYVDNELQDAIKKVSLFQYYLDFGYEKEVAIRFVRLFLQSLFGRCCR